MSGKGHRCFSKAEVLNFQALASAANAWIDIVEVFEHEGGAEIPRIDLSLYGDHGSYDLPGAERKKLAVRRLGKMLSLVEVEQKSFTFVIWLDSAG